ncbi:MAG: metal-dependent transcriptional regulator [Bacteroidota bacterium]
MEDYLRSLYRLEARDGEASNAALAKELNITSSAVTEMARRLAEGGFLSYQKYHGLKLTKEGRDVAVRITRRHRLWEVFLIRDLGFSWDEVHDLADQFEHIGTDDLIDRLEAFLGHPTHDPHGDPIPDRDGRILDRPLIPLSQLEAGETGTVERVSDEFPELLRYASSLGLAIKAEVKVIEKIAFDASVRMVANGRESMVSEKLANSVFILRAGKSAAPAAGTRSGKRKAESRRKG